MTCWVQVVTHVLPQQEISSGKKIPTCLDGAVGRMPEDRHVPVMVCWLRVGGVRALLFNQLLGLEEATQVEDLPSGQSNEAEH